MSLGVGMSINISILVLFGFFSTLSHWFYCLFSLVRLHLISDVIKDITYISLFLSSFFPSFLSILPSLDSRILLQNGFSTVLGE